MNNTTKGMNNLMIFSNPEFGQVRSLTIDSEPWFVGKDAAEILGYTNPSKALADHVDEDDKLNNESLLSFDLDLGQRGGWLINESGLYSLIFGSKLKKAKEFKRWVTYEVLPSIRKTGAYSAKPQLDYKWAAELVAGCRPKSLPYVIDILQQAGFGMGAPVQPQPVAIQAEVNTVVEFIGYVGVDALRGHITNVVYGEYQQFCIVRDMMPVHKIEFSRQVAKRCGFTVADKWINGAKCRVFI